MPGCECVGQPGNTMFCQDDVGSDVGYIDTYADITPDKPYCQNRPFGISNSAGTGKGPWFVLRAENEFSQGEYYENCRASDLNGSGIYDTYDDRICGGDNPSNWISDLLDIPTYGQYLFSDEQKCIAAGEWLEANYIFSYTFYGCEMIINQFGETEELSTDDMYSSLFGGTREFATGGPVGKNPREDLIRDPGGHCCDEGPGSYGPAICDPGGTNTIVGLGTGNCHMDSYIPEGAYEQHVGQYCSSPGSVSGPCVCNVDCGTWAWCTINLGSTSNWSQNQTCADLLNMDWAPDCPDEFEENENGDCVCVGTINCPSGLILDEDGVCVDPGDPDFTCNCCPELEGSGTYHCQLNSDGHVVLIDDCNYEFGAMLPIPHVFANAEGYYDDQGVERGLCGLTWGNEDIMEEFGIDNIDDINDHGDGKGQGVTLGTFACGCDCLFHTAEGYSYNAANAFWPFTNGEGTSCDGSIDIAEYYGGSVNVSWMGPVLLDDGSSSQENAWETWSSMPSNPNEAYDIISDLAEEDFATMECNEPNLQNSANQGYYKYTPYSLNWCEVGGCINPLASNYNPRATEQTTTCTCPDGSNYNDNYISGCLDSAAGGYNPNARCDCAGNNCIEGNVCVDNYTGMCTDFPWLCDTSCCTYVQNNAECGAQCQGMYELALYNNYNSVAHRYIDWDYIYRKISEPGTVWFNSDINECMQSYSCALYGSNRLFSSYNEMILAGYNAYGCPDGESCVWGSKLISGQIVTGQICKWTGENSYEGSSGGSTGGTSLGGTRNFTPEEGGIGLIDGPQSPVGTHQENIS